MPFTTGTAANSNALLKAIRTYLTGLVSPWTSLEYSENSAVLTGASHRYWRLWVRQVQSGATITIGDIEFRATVSGADQTGSGLALSYQFSGTPANAYNGLSSSFWTGTISNDPDNNNTWIGYDFGTPVAVREVAVLNRNAFVSQSPTLVEVEWSDDGEHWQLEWQFTSTPDWVVSETRVFANPNAVSTPVLTKDGLDILHLQAPGTGAGREVYVSMRTKNDRINDFWNIQISAGTGFTSGLAWGTQPGAPGASTYVTMNLWDNGTIPYWIYASDRRVLVVCKIDTSYVRLYAGFFNPYALPAEYPFPLFIGGDSDTTKFLHNDFSPTRGCFENSNSSISGRFRDWNGTWHPIQNREGNVNGYVGGSGAFIWPKHGGGTFGSIDSNSWWDGGAGGSFLSRMEPTVQNEVPLWEAIIVDRNAINGGPHGMIGQLEGVYVAPGHSIVAEQTDVKGGDTYRWFPDINQTGIDHWMLVKEI